MDFPLILEMALIAGLIGIFKVVEEEFLRFLLQSSGSYSHETMIIKDLRSKSVQISFTFAVYITPFD